MRISETNLVRDRELLGRLALPRNLSSKKISKESESQLRLLWTGEGLEIVDTVHRGVFSQK